MSVRRAMAGGALFTTLCGAALFVTAFAGRLERPFMRMAASIVGVTNRLGAVATVSITAFVLVWLVIGLLCLWQWRAEGLRPNNDA